MLIHGWGCNTTSGWLQVCFNTTNYPAIKRIKIKGQVVGSGSDLWRTTTLTITASNDYSSWLTIDTINLSNNNYGAVDVTINDILSCNNQSRILGSAVYAGL